MHLASALELVLHHYDILMSTHWSLSCGRRTTPVKWLTSLTVGVRCLHPQQAQHTWRHQPTS